MNPFDQAWAVLKEPQRKLKYNLPLSTPPWMKRGAGKQGGGHLQSQSIAQGTSPSDEGAIVPPSTRHTQLSGGKHYSLPLSDSDYEGQELYNPNTVELDNARNQAFADAKEMGMMQGLEGEELEQFIMEQMQQHLSKMLLKGRMSDIHIGFQEDPQKEIAQLLHQGLSKDQAMALYQQYVNSLGDTGRV